MSFKDFTFASSFAKADQKRCTAFVKLTTRIDVSDQQTVEIFRLWFFEIINPGIDVWKNSLEMENYESMHHYVDHFIRLAGEWFCFAVGKAIDWTYDLSYEMLSMYIHVFGEYVNYMLPSFSRIAGVFFGHEAVGDNVGEIVGAAIEEHVGEASEEHVDGPEDGEEVGANEDDGGAIGEDGGANEDDGGAIAHGAGHFGIDWDADDIQHEDEDDHPVNIGEINDIYNRENDHYQRQDDDDDQRRQ